VDLNGNRFWRPAAAIFSTLYLALAASVSARAQDVSAPVIFQWFEASYKTMERRTGDAFLAGYGSLWTPPPGRADSGNQSVGYDVYDRFDLGKPGSPTLYGTETGLRNVVSSVHRAGMDIYIDYIINHSGFSNLGTQGFQNAGGYPGFVLTRSGAIDGDYHTAFPPQGPDYEYQFRLSGLVDIDHRTNFNYIRSPVPGFANNIPAGTTPAFGRLANVPDENNRRLYPDRSLQPILVFDPQTGEQNIPIYPFNAANPMAGDPVQENAMGYLMRYAQWMVQSVGVDGFRVDAARHVYPFAFNYFDRAVYRSSQRPYLDGSPRQVFSFLEAYTGDKGQLQSLTRKNINPNDPGRVGGNRDVLDFPLFFAMRYNLTGNGTVNNWHKIRGASQDSQDDGSANNGSQSVAFAVSHDDFGPYLSNVAHAFILMRPGNAVVYHNAKEFGMGRDFPKDGRGDALGGFYGNTITKLVEIRNSHGRGTFRERWVDEAFNPNGFSNIYIYERDKSAVVGLNSRLDGGFDSRNGVQTAFAAGTHLIELTGNASDIVVDPLNDIPSTLTVDSQGRIDMRVPRNRNANNVEHGKGYVIYGLATPQGTLSISNVSKVIAAETPTAITNGTARLAGINVITADSFNVQLNTTAMTLSDGFRDRDADGDNALLRLDEGTDLNTNGQVDFRTPGSVTYGFENFAVSNPGYTAPSGNGNYQQTVNAAALGEGYHYLTARAFRRRGDGGPAVFSDFKKVLYVDRAKPVSEIASFEPITPGVNENRDLVVRSVDGTAYRLTPQEMQQPGAPQKSGVHVLLDVPAAFTDQDILGVVGTHSQAGQFDRDLWKYGFFGLTHGNHVATVVTYEITGKVNVQRLAGLFTQTSNGRGLGDLNFDDQFTTADISNVPNAFEDVLYSRNMEFNAAADIDGNGSINATDLVQLGPTLVAGGASRSVLDAWQGVRFRRANLSLDFGNDRLDAADVEELRSHFNATGSAAWPYDLTADGNVDAADETFFNTHFNPVGAVTVRPGGTFTALDIRGTQLILPTSGTRAVVAEQAGGGGLAVLDELQMAAGSKLDLKNNGLVFHATEATKDTVIAQVQHLIASAQNGVDGEFLTRWDGPGIASTSARAGNVGAGFDLYSLGAIRNSDLSIATGVPGSHLTEFRGELVGEHDVLARYTYTGDANLDGVVSFDDYAAMDSAFFGLIPNVGWATGDINLDGVIDFDDYSVVDQAFFFQGAPLGASSIAVPEPKAVVFAALAVFAGLLHLRRRRWFA
jgi:glycosidase